MKPTSVIIVAAAAVVACVVRQDAPRPEPVENGPPPPAEGMTYATPPPDAAVVAVAAPPARPDAAPQPVAAKKCGGWEPGACPAGETCHSCSQAARNSFFCASACRTDADCKDPARPSCEGAPPKGGAGAGFCARRGMLHHCQSKCAAPDTPILTPFGERPIASLRVGDLVYSVDAGRVVAVPVVAIGSTPAQDHQVARVTLAGGAVLLVSHEHPTADGRTFGQLAPGDRLGDAVVDGAQSVPYPFDTTYDILPDSDSGAYFAGGALIGSTLQEPYLTEQP